MEITLEQVERLREKAPVSYAQAKQALEYSGGNLLDALIYLEEQDAIPREEGAYYSTKGEGRPAPPPEAPGQPPEQAEKRGKKAASAPSAPKSGKADGKKRLLPTLRRWLVDNELEYSGYKGPNQRSDCCPGACAGTGANLSCNTVSGIS